MRYINPEEVRRRLPPGWPERSAAARAAVEPLEEEERSKAINEKAAVWRDLKDTLKGVFHGKCWYCESIQERSDNAVDHYRPKNRVAECPDHCGYWWLAFEWSNYRFCCTYCNSKRIDQDADTSGGKHDHFPVWDEARRAQCADDVLDDEQPMLLDPICEDDPPLLWFDEDGRAVPNPTLCQNEDSFVYQRTCRSIELYHLNHVGIVERRSTLASEIKDITEKADRYFIKYERGDMTAKKSFADRIKELRNKVKSDAEYSAAAHAILMGLRGTSAIAEIVLAQC